MMVPRSTILAGFQPFKATIEKDVISNGDQERLKAIVLLF